jgi:hypothetical protein
MVTILITVRTRMDTILNTVRTRMVIMLTPNQMLLHH